MPAALLVASDDRDGAPAALQAVLAGGDARATAPVVLATARVITGLTLAPVPGAAVVVYVEQGATAHHRLVSLAVRCRP